MKNRICFNCIFIIVIYLLFNVVLSHEDGFECVKRKSGACKVFSITDDFDKYIPVSRHRENDSSIDEVNIIFEIDYLENKNIYEEGNSARKKELDIDDNPVVEILISEDKKPGKYSFRLVLGEKLNRLAFLDVRDLHDTHTEYNNYSPDLPPWPFVINVSLIVSENFNTNLSVYQIGSHEPFISSYGKALNANFISMRNRNKGTKLVGFYECSPNYGSYCGVEKKQRISDCRKKITPVGSGLYKTFIDMSSFNRDHDGYDVPVVFNEIFGIYRRDDNMHILFTSFKYESETYIRLSIGDGIQLRIRTLLNETSNEYWEKSVYRQHWNEQPTQPYFIRVSIISETKTISVWSLDENQKSEPILSLDLCNYFSDDNDINFMAVTSDHFKTVTLYYDCCDDNDLDDCHVNIKERNRDTEESDSGEENDFVATTEQYFENVKSTTVEENNNIVSDATVTTTEAEQNVESMTDSAEMVTIAIATTEPENLDQSEVDESDDDDDDDNYDNDVHEYDKELFDLIPSENFTKSYLDTRKFHDSDVAKYSYKDGDSDKDWCPNQIKDVDLKNEIESNNDYSWDNYEEIDNSDKSDNSGPIIDPGVLKSLLG